MRCLLIILFIDVGGAQFGSLSIARSQLAAAGTGTKIVFAGGTYVVKCLHFTDL